MFTKTFITAVTATFALLGAASAFAEGPEASSPEQAFTSPAQAVKSNLTRAQVRAEAIAARQGYQRFAGELSFVDEPFMSTLTREQVRAETLEAIRLHAIGHGEKNVFPSAEQLESIRMAGERALTMKVAAR
jgi:broad specificity phosphatase PhoE